MTLVIQSDTRKEEPITKNEMRSPLPTNEEAIIVDEIAIRIEAAVTADRRARNVLCLSLT